MSKAIIFDFDNVLVYSEKPHFQALQKVAKLWDVTISDDLFHKKVGRTTKYFLSDVLGEKEQSLIPEIISAYEREYKQHILRYVTPIQASTAFIRNYRGSAVLGIASMSSKSIVEKVIQHMGIAEKFSSVICKEDVAYPKPHPHIYLSSAQALGVEPEQCIVIEDTIVGVDAALAAGMQCFVLLNGINTEHEFVGKRIAGFLKTEKDLETLL